MPGKQKNRSTAANQSLSRAVGRILISGAYKYPVPKPRGFLRSSLRLKRYRGLA